MTLPLAISRLIAPALLLALAACGSQPDKQDKAGGEILPGSASDAMLPLDTVTSQPPLAPRPAAPSASDAASDVPEGEGVAAPAPSPQG